MQKSFSAYDQIKRALKIGLYEKATNLVKSHDRYLSRKQVKSLLENGDINVEILKFLTKKSIHRHFIAPNGCDNLGDLYIGTFLNNPEVMKTAYYLAAHTRAEKSGFNFGYALFISCFDPSDARSLRFLIKVDQVRRPNIKFKIEQAVLSGVIPWHPYGKAIINTFNPHISFVIPFSANRPYLIKHAIRKGDQIGITSFQVVMGQADCDESRMHLTYLLETDNIAYFENMFATSPNLKHIWHK